MFKKTTNYLKKTAKSVLSSGRLKTLALMLLVGGDIAGFHKCNWKEHSK